MLIMVLALIVSGLMFVAGVEWQKWVDHNELGSIVTTIWGGRNED
jgi:hypothetical protein